MRKGAGDLRTPAEGSTDGSITVREAAVRDFPIISDLFEEVDRLHREHLPTLFRKPRGAPREETFIVGLIRSQDAGVFLAEMGVQTVGLVIVVTRKAPDFPILVSLYYAVIDTIVVAERARGQGVGHALMARAEAWARDRGLRQVELNVFEFNQAALDFYEGMGYTTLSRQMVKHLDPDVS